MGRNNVKRNIKSKIAEQAGDVTLSDCADNPRKMNTRRPRINLKSIDKDSVLVPDDASSDSDELLPTHAEHDGKPVKQLKESVTVHTYENHYPQDVWFLIARYVSPSDICRFALICKDAYNTVCSVRYWRYLYRRFKTGNIHDMQIPYDLKVCSDTKKGLRARVIRLAFLNIPSLTEAIKNPFGSCAEPYRLHGMRLILAWHEKERSNWNYFFKWTGQPVDLVKKHKNDLFENEEHGFRVLKVTCSDFIRFRYPDHQYSYLSTIQLGLTSDMRHQKLTLGFSDYITTHRTSNTKHALGHTNFVQNTIELSPITKCVILDWWHPDYPYPRSSLRQIILPCNDNEEW